jgi:hypothetical protein
VGPARQPGQRPEEELRGHRPGQRRPGQRPEAAGPARRHAGDLGRRVRAATTAGTTTRTASPCGWPAAG